MAEASEKPNGTTEDGEAGKRGKTRKVVMASLLGILLMAGAGGGVVMSLGMDGALALVGLGADADGGVEDGGAPEDVADANVPSDVMIFDDLIVNLVTIEGSANRYARVRLAVIYDRQAPGMEALDAKRQGLRETFNDYLSQLTERDLQGTYGLNVLKRELVRRARIVGGGGDAVADVLVTDLVFQ